MCHRTEVEFVSRPRYVAFHRIGILNHSMNRRVVDQPFNRLELVIGYVAFDFNLGDNLRNARRMGLRTLHFKQEGTSINTIFQILYRYKSMGYVTGKSEKHDY